MKVLLGRFLLACGPAQPESGRKTGLFCDDFQICRICHVAQRTREWSGPGCFSESCDLPQAFHERVAFQPQDSPWSCITPFTFQTAYRSEKKWLLVLRTTD